MCSIAHWSKCECSSRNGEEMINLMRKIMKEKIIKKIKWEEEKRRGKIENKKLRNKWERVWRNIWMQSRLWKRFGWDFEQNLMIFFGPIWIPIHIKRIGYGNISYSLFLSLFDGICLFLYFFKILVSPKPINRVLFLFCWLCFDLNFMIFFGSFSFF